MTRRFSHKQAAESFRAHCEKFGMTQIGMGRFLGVSQRQSRRLAAGDVQLSRATEMLFALMNKYKVTPEQAYKLIGMELPAIYDQRVKDE